MIISLNWLKEYVDIDVSAEELATLIGARLVEVEETVDLAAKYRGATIVRVMSAEKVEGSDHLTLTKVDDGGITKGVERDAEGLVQVVCGAPNVTVGMATVWLPPEMTVPATYGTDDPFVLGVRELKGYKSNGMLASISELDLGEDHDGIVRLREMDLKPGNSFMEQYGLDDVLLDIENKSLTHRPDCFGIVGFAREVAGILGKRFETPEWLDCELNTASAQDQRQLGSNLPATTEKLDIEIKDAELCPRYQAVVISKCVCLDDRRPWTTGLSEMDLKLIKSGMRPIDPVVDMTNYLMLLTGQPLHAFDYDKLVKVGGLETPKIIVRVAKKGEKLELLDGRMIECDENDILITSNDVPVALAGAMGCKNTVIDEGTKNIIVESATFSLYNLRRTQMKHGIFSEAITRFTKGQPAELTEPVVRRYGVTGYMAESEIFDCYPRKQEKVTVELTTEDINGLLGTNYKVEEVMKVLGNVEMKVGVKVGAGGMGTIRKIVAHSTSMLYVHVPYWRTDIHIKEDIIEEVGRLLGYDNVPIDLPKRKFEAVAPDKLGDLKARIRGILSKAGANEVLTYSFVHSDLLKKAEQDLENSYQIVNSISPELEYCRQSLTPSLLDKASMNLKAGYEKFALFEINRISQKSDGLNDEKVPVEKNKVAMMVVDKKVKGAVYYEAKKYVEYLMGELGVEVKFMAMEKKLSSTSRPFELKRTAEIQTADGKMIGIVGEYKNSVRKAFKLPEYAAGFEFSIENIEGKVSELAGEYKKMSRYQSVERDLTLKVASEVEYACIEEVLREALDTFGLDYAVEPVSIWQGEDKATKNVSFRLRFASYEGTLGKGEITKIMDAIVKTASLESGLNAEVV